MNVIDQIITEKYALYNGDSAEILQGLPSDSVHYQIYSPPFLSLFTYSNSERDLGNCRTKSEFYEQFLFIAKELYRTLKPGRLMSVHCMDLPLIKERDGVIGLTDFPGELIKFFQDIGFIYHSRVVIWKDPLIEATRTKALGLMHKQIMRKPGDNDEAIAHLQGFNNFIGEDEPVNKTGEYSHHVWRRYASPVWMDIRQTNTLNGSGAREEKDERHICPLAIDVIERGIELWSNPSDIVLTPFLGIGSEAYVAVKKNRFAIGIELKHSYFMQAVKNCANAALLDNKLTILDME